ncbi:MAG TPA: putative toxin-antitoxin system toxin component, PIN family [Thermodesulfobacteriota bacterium]|nr:putative toxin-antitoxin system toxin component, PIN family [Thermodesulfobacteriota bacterium]
MRVVFDTNIFVSAFVILGSLAEKAILKIIEGDDTLLLSKGILDELLTVLSTKFSRDREEISRVAVILSEMTEWVKPTLQIGVLKDEPDNRVLECAVGGKADVIVTGDKEMLRLTNYERTKLVSLKAYLEV